MSRPAALALLLALAPALARATPPPPSPSEAAAKAEAVRAVASASAAFAAGDITGALAHFEAAMRLRPSTKLHYNIGVCHQRLTREAAARGDAAAESRHASAAIEAFNAYLRANPDAKDRVPVEDLVRQLGGTPATQAQLRDPLAPRIDPPEPDRVDPGPDQPARSDAPPGEPDRVDARPLPGEPDRIVPSPPPDPPAAIAPRGYFGVDLGLVTQPQLLANTGLDGAYQGLVAIRGGARLGPRRRIELGADLGLALPGQTRATNLALSAQRLVIDLGHAIPLGRHRRLELALGGLVGVVREALRVRAGQALPACATGTAGTLVSARAGGVVGGRVGFAVLVGARRNHELGMHITLAFHGFGPGGAAATPAQCDERPFAAQSVPRARFVITGALGYALRF